MGYILVKSGTNESYFSRKVASWRRITCLFRSLVNARDLQLECARVFHEALLLPVLMYGSEIVVEGEGES